MYCLKYLFLAFATIAAHYCLKAQSLPVANNDSFTVQRNVTTLLPVVSNDFDADGDSLSISVLIPPSNGNASVVFNAIDYTPDLNYTGADSLQYLLCETNTTFCDSAWVFLLVEASNTAPQVSVSDFTFGDSISSVLIDPLAFDAEGDSIYISSIWPTDTSVVLGDLLSQGTQFIFIRSGLSCGFKTFRYLLCDGFVCDTNFVSITIVCPADISLPQGFSPNGDGVNDKLVFSDIAYFSPAALRVFNRYGTTVYDSDNYQNEWDGTANESGRPLPDGTYYYTLKLADGRKYNNYLVINR